LFHSDAAQSIGKITIDVSDLLVDMLTVVGHKFGAPKGISALYLGDFARSLVYKQ
jgi:cysteine desulfurase